MVISPGSVGTSRTEPGAIFVVSTTGKHARVRDVISSLQHGCHQQRAARHKEIAEEESVVRGDGKPQRNAKLNKHSAWAKCRNVQTWLADNKQSGDTYSITIHMHATGV